MIDTTLRALDATVDFVDVVLADAAAGDVASLTTSLARLDAARRALRALTPAEREYCAFVVDRGGTEAALAHG